MSGTLDDARAELERRVLRKPRRGPAHSTQFSGLKPIVDDLVLRGWVNRFRAPGASVPLMLALTPAGAAAIVEAAT